MKLKRYEVLNDESWCVIVVRPNALCHPELARDLFNPVPRSGSKPLVHWTKSV